MSNCVDVKGGVYFPMGTINAEALTKEIAAVKDLKNVDYDRDGATKYFTWWFIEGAVIIHSNGSVTWYPGRGCRSSHTWRDLAGTIHILSQFAIQRYQFWLTIRDIDAPTAYGRERFELKREVTSGTQQQPA